MSNAIESVTATNLRRKLHDALQAAEGGKTVTITRHGKVVAALISGTDLELLQRSTKTPTKAALGLDVHPVDANGSPVEAGELAEATGELAEVVAAEAKATKALAGPEGKTGMLIMDL